MAEKQNKGKRRDKNRLKLRKGESQRKNGLYDYRWTTPDGKRHAIYAATLDELREKEEAISSDKRDGIKVEVKRITVNDNIKAIQDVLGHKDISTTTDIYVDVTKELKKKEFDNLGDFFG